MLGNGEMAENFVSREEYLVFKDVDCLGQELRFFSLKVKYVT